MQRSAAVRIASAMLAGTALALAVACRDHDATRPVAPASSGASAARGSGAIWTTIDDCVTTQDANHYAVGHVIVINTSDFDEGE